MTQYENDMTQEEARDAMQRTLIALQNDIDPLQLATSIETARQCMHALAGTEQDHAAKLWRGLTMIEQAREK